MEQWEEAGVCPISKGEVVMKAHKETIEVEVVRSNSLGYKPKGLIEYKCLCCGHKTEIRLKGLVGDSNVTPVVKLKWGWL